MKQLLRDGRINRAEFSRRLYPNLSPPSALATLDKRTKNDPPTAADVPVLENLAQEFRQLADEITSALDQGPGRPNAALRRARLLLLMKDGRLKQRGLAQAAFPGIASTAAATALTRRIQGVSEMPDAEASRLYASLMNLAQLLTRASAPYFTAAATELPTPGSAGPPPTAPAAPASPAPAYVPDPTAFSRTE